MKKFLIVSLLSTVFLIACTKESSKQDEAIACAEARFGSITLNETACNNANMYFYKEDFWTISESCCCDPLPMAYDCEGEALCDIMDDCMIEFREQAELLFSFTYD